jgi:hypothetical protein
MKLTYGRSNKKYNFFQIGHSKSRRVLSILFFKFFVAIKY